MDAGFVVGCLLDGIIRVDKNLVDRAVAAIYSGLDDAHKADTNKRMSSEDTFREDEEFQSVTAKALNIRLKEAGLVNFSAQKFQKGLEAPAGFTPERGGFVLLDLRIKAHAP